MTSMYYKRKLILLLGDIILISIAIQLSPLIRLGRLLNVFDVYTGASTIVLFLYIVILYIFDMYNIERDFRSGESILNMVVAISVVAIFATFFFYSLPSWKYSRGILGIQIVIVLIFIIGWRLLFPLIFSMSFHKKNALILGAGQRGKALASLLATQFSPYRIIGYLDDDLDKQGKTIGTSKVIGTMAQLEKIISNMDVSVVIVAFNPDSSSDLVRTILKARLNGIVILEMPTVYENLMKRVPVKHVYDRWLLFADGFYLVSKEYVRKVKRLIDISISSFLLILTLPIILITALAIKLDSPGPILFKQKRVGKNGEIFEILKLRTMAVNAGENGVTWTKQNDPRITRVGKWIRLFRIDELPQLYNVLIGEMSLIGPRPEQPEFVMELEKKIPYYGIRNSVSPGITGWAQVNYGYGSSIEDAISKLEYDLYYIKNMSLVLDLKIILKTIGVVIFRLGAR